MVKQGSALPGALTKYLPPLSDGNHAALLIFNRLGRQLSWPDVEAELILSGVDDIELMLERLRALRDFDKHG